jgi:hypothetical protein
MDFLLSESSIKQLARSLLSIGDFLNYVRTDQIKFLYHTSNFIRVPMLAMPLVFVWMFSINFMIFVQVKIEIYLLFFLKVHLKISNSSMILNPCLQMTYSRKSTFASHFKINIDFIFLS